MKRKRTRQDSLELFLDAICNVFGGFLFIMLFVVISVRASVDAKMQNVRKTGARPVATVELNAMKDELDALTQELDARQAEKKEAIEYAEKMLDPQIVEKFKETKNLIAQLKRLTDENNERQKKNQEVRALYQKTMQESDDLKKEYELVLDKEREKAKRKRARSTVPPKLRDVFKSEITVLVKYGRVYFWEKYNEQGKLVAGYNDDDLFVAERRPIRNAIVTEPKPWRGVPLDDPNVETRLDEMFRRFNPAYYYILMCVAKDSFAEYNVLSSYLKSKGFDINAWALDDKEEVYDRGGGLKPTQ